MSKQKSISKKTAIRQAFQRLMFGEDGTAGAALVEATIIAPILVVMSIYVMDFGLLFYNKMRPGRSLGELFDVTAGLVWRLAGERAEAIGADHVRLRDGRAIMRRETTGGRSRGVAGVSALLQK